MKTPIATLVPIRLTPSSNVAPPRRAGFARRAAGRAVIAASALASLCGVASAQCHGGGTPGGDGRVPRLTVTSMESGSLASVTVTNLSASARRVHIGWRLAEGCRSVADQFGPGAMLVPRLNSVPTARPPYAPTIDAGLRLPATTFTSRVPETWAGRMVYVQAFVDDPDAFGGFALSDGFGVPVGGGTTDAPERPTDVAARALSSSEIALSFVDRSANEDGFVVERRGEFGSFAEVARIESSRERRTGSGETVTWNDSGLAAETTYFYRLFAYNVAGPSPPSDVASATTHRASAPAAPGELRAEATSSRTVRVTFRDLSVDESGFRVERRRPGAAFASVGLLASDAGQRSRTGDTLAFDDSGLEPGTLYDYRVVAYNGYGEASSAVFSVRTPDEVPEPPGDLTASAASGTLVQLAWTDRSDDEDAFVVERRLGSAPFAVIASVESDAARRESVGGVRAYSDPTVSAGFTYTYRIRARNAAGSSAPSNEADVDTPVESPPDAPAGLVATTLSESSIRIDWTDTSDDEDGFRVERRTGGGAWELIAHLGSDAAQRNARGITRSQWDAGLESATTYAYRVRAYNPHGSSAWSNEASARTHGEDPGMVASVPTIGQDAHATVFRGTTLFLLARTFGLQSIDVSDPSHPRILASLPIENRLNALRFVGDAAVIAGGPDGLVVVDTSDPSEPVVLASLPLADYRSSDLAVVGSLAYVADNAGGLEIVDLSNPARPVRVGSIPLPGSAFGVDSAGGVAYVACGTSGVHVVDVSTPSAPVHLTTIATPAPAYRARLGPGGSLWITEERAGFQVADVRDPRRATVVSSFGSPSGTKDVEFIGTTALTIEYDAGMRAFDVSDPLRPRLLTQTPFADRLLSIDSQGSLAVVSSLANGIDILDVTRPSGPVRVGAHRPPVAVNNVAVTPNGIVLTTGNRGLQAIDVREPAAPTVEYQESTIEATGAVDVSGRLAAVSTGSRLALVDLDALGGPLERSSLVLPDSVSGLDFSGDRLYVADFRGGLIVVSVAEPDRPAIVGTLALSYALGVVVSGTYAYVGAGIDGVVVVNVSDPARPFVSGRVDTLGSAGSVSIAGSNLAVADGAGGLQMVDVSHPASPRLLGRADTPGAASGVFMDGTIVLLADGDQGVQIYDVSDASAPSHRGTIQTTGRTRMVTGVPGLAFATDNESWISIITYR